MTTNHTALIEEAKRAMEGTTGSRWFSAGAVVADGNGDLLANLSAASVSVTEQPFKERKANAAFIAWCGNGGVRRLIEALEERDG